MDLEFKILREKVSEDEKKASIGSLYDDDKTSHQHIMLLKQKYAEMLQNFHKRMTQLRKKDLEIKEQTFLLQTNLKYSKELNETLRTTVDSFKRESQQKKKTADDNYRKINAERTNLENEVTITLKNELDKTANTRFDHKMIIDKDAAFEEIMKKRHDLECKELRELIVKKKASVEELKQGQEKYEADWLAHKDLQDAIKETNELREAIEKAKVEIQAAQIKIQNLQDTTEALNKRKEELLDEKKDAELRNEDLKTAVKSQQEMA